MVKMHMPILSTAEQAAQAGLRKGMGALRDRARELSPTLTGESDKSAFVAIDDLTGQVGFTSLVSLLQHEHLEWQHPDGGIPKFLEVAAQEVDVIEYVADEIRKAFS
ncbi:hypothetical protein [Microbacterium sp. NPDC058389]|uniref:hypothetical protein n=1 Tax=Microbacterium sp. NPDC058389 TaxID=3346475 RepID=UPI0036582067